MTDCIKERCHSPTACGGFGYCRARNDGHHGEYRFVKHSEIAAYEATGWEVIDNMADCHHGAHAVIMGKR